MKIYEYVCVWKGGVKGEKSKKKYDLRFAFSLLIGLLLCNMYAHPFGISRLQSEYGVFLVFYLYFNVMKWGWDLVLKTTKYFSSLFLSFSLSLSLGYF